MKSENRIPLTRLEACTLMAREAVSLLEGGAEALDSGTEFREALALLCAAQDLGDGGALLAWVDAELESARRFAKTGERTESLEKELPRLLLFYQEHLHWGRFGKAMECMEDASALALAAYTQELRQLGGPVDSENLAQRLCAHIHPHQNRSVLKNRHRELAIKVQAVLAKKYNPGVRSAEDKRQLAEEWLDLAADFAKVSIKYEAEEWKKWQKQQQESKQAMTM